MRKISMNWMGTILIALGFVAFVWAGPGFGSDVGCVSDDSTVQAAGGLVISDDGETVSYDGVAGETALETLCDLTLVNTEETSFGPLVTGIAGVMAEDNESFWAFWVNDELAQEGAGTYTAEEGDEFEWQLTEIKL